MKPIDTYSKRLKRAEQSGPDVYRYDKLPTKLRLQICHIIEFTAGNRNEYQSDRYTQRYYDAVVNTLRNELGRRTLVKLSIYDDAADELLEFIENEVDTLHLLDGIEIAFIGVKNICGGNFFRNLNNAGQRAQDAIDALNIRFKENEIGFYFSDGVLSKIDSTFGHGEIIKPALAVLSDPIFAGANDEFRGQVMKSPFTGSSSCKI